IAKQCGRVASSAPQPTLGAGFKLAGLRCGTAVCANHHDANRATPFARNQRTVALTQPRRKRASSMTTLVTGAAGFLGSHIARQLVARGETVRVLVRASSSNRAISDLSLEYVTGDLRDVGSLERAMAGMRRVFNVAADYRLW